MLPSGFSDNSETSITPVWILVEHQRCYMSSLCLVHYFQVLEGSLAKPKPSDHTSFTVPPRRYTRL